MSCDRVPCFRRPQCVLDKIRRHCSGRRKHGTPPTTLCLSQPIALLGGALRVSCNGCDGKERAPTVCRNFPAAAFACKLFRQPIPPDFTHLLHVGRRARPHMPCPTYRPPCRYLRL